MTSPVIENDPTQYGKVTWTGLISRIDSNYDADDEPDKSPVTGTIIFKPSTTYLKFLQAVPVFTVFLIDRPVNIVDAQIDEQGRKYVKLEACSVNSVPESFTWTAVFNLEYNGRIIRVPDAKFALQPGQTLDLSTVLAAVDVVQYTPVQLSAAVTARLGAEAARDQAILARDRAESAGTGIFESESRAADSADNAAQSASAASGSAQAASNSAGRAETAAGSSETFKNQAQTAATQAQGHATAANTSKTDAAASATAANASKTDAEASATDANTSKTDAADSATAANASKTDAADSATAANASKNAAANSATEASGHADRSEAAATRSEAAETGSKSARDTAVSSAAQTQSDVTTTGQARDQAVSAASSADASKQAAASSATDANASKLAAAASAQEAASYVPGDAVVSVNGQVGVVNLTKSDVGLSNVDNTSDSAKPVSAATQAALNGKVDAFEGAVKGPVYISPESPNAAVIPYYMNDLAFTTLRGGAVRIYYDGVLQSPGPNLAPLFAPDATSLNIPHAGVTEIVVEVDSHRTFSYGTKLGYAVNEQWRARDVKIEYFRPDTSEWVVAMNGTNITSGEVYTQTSLSNWGVSQFRFTFKNWVSGTHWRCGQIYALSYSSQLGSGPFLSRDGGDVYGHVSTTAGDPTSANHYSRKSYVDDGDSARLPKRTGNNLLYTNDASGNPNGINYTSSATATTMMLRDSAGRSQVATPSGTSDIANKSYVDTQVGTREATANKGVANGYASLDGGGKIPSSQLPTKVMEYQGVWNPATNTPTLVNGTGNQGDVYRVSTAGSRDLGAGAISFDVGDYVIYNGTQWEKSDTTDAVASVAGKTGIVTLAAGDIASGTFDVARIPTITKSKLEASVQTSLNKADTAKQESDLVFGALPASGVTGKLYVVPPA